jgi:PEP-CTERM motif
MKPTTHPICLNHTAWHRILALPLGCALYLASSTNVRAAANVLTDIGLTAADIADVVTQFRDIFGGNPNGNGNNGGGPFADGFRNVNWDAPGLPEVGLPGAFFNSGSALRGLLMTNPTPGGGFLISSATLGGDFGNINAAYPASFQPFSGARIFAAAGSTVIDNSFFVPSSPTTAASVLGFGVVFTDVDILGSTTLEFFDLNGVSLGIFNAPVMDNGLSFIGVSFDAGELVGSVSITSGNAALSGTAVDVPGTIDVVAMDDFMYSEPQAVVPEPGTTALILLGVGSVAALRRRTPVTAFG